MPISYIEPTVDDEIPAEASASAYCCVEEMDETDPPICGEDGATAPCLIPAREGMDGLDWIGWQQGGRKLPPSDCVFPACRVFSGLFVAHHRFDVICDTECVCVLFLQFTRIFRAVFVCSALLEITLDALAPVWLHVLS